MPSRIWIVCSDCPSVWGWYEVLNFRQVSRFSWRLSQECDQNLVSLSDMMLTWALCRRNIFLIYLFSRTSIDWSTLNGRKWADFVRQLMTTHTALLPLGLHRAVTKFIVMCSHFHSGIDNGCRVQLFSDILSLSAGKPSTWPHTGLSLSS